MISFMMDSMTALWNLIKPKDYHLRIAQALSDATRCGRPISFTAEQVVKIIAMACEVKDGSDEATSHWTRSEIVREAAQRLIIDIDGLGWQQCFRECHGESVLG